MISQRAPRRRSRRDRRVVLPDPLELPTNVVVLHQRVLPCHTQLLARWLAAGHRMGLCDASAFRPERRGAVASAPPHDYVLVWVRENTEPAYMIVPDGVRWAVVDTLRQHTLSRVPSFAAALDFIRPVLPAEPAT